MSTILPQVTAMLNYVYINDPSCLILTLSLSFSLSLSLSLSLTHTHICTAIFEGIFHLVPFICTL